MITRIDRRRLLQLSGAGAVAAGSGLAGILATGRAPAYAQTTTVHWLRWSDFVPASDKLLLDQIVVLALTRILVMLCVFLIVERACHSSRAGGVGVGLRQAAENRIARTT